MIIFGGCGDDYHDEIYLLDLTKDEGWQKLDHIKCPQKSSYMSILTDDNYVHIYTEINAWPSWWESKPGHYSISIKSLIIPIDLT